METLVFNKWTRGDLKNMDNNQSTHDRMCLGGRGMESRGGGGGVECRG